MTLIIAIQAKDSIIISADKRVVSAKIKDTDTLSFHSDKCKLHLWEKGIITGSGEVQVIKQMNQWLQQKQNILRLPKKLNDIKKKRIIEIGQHKHITNTSIIFSSKDKEIPQLYAIGLNNKLEKLPPNDIAILLPIEPDFSSESMSEFHNLYAIRGGSICLNNRSQIISDKFTVKKSNLPHYIIMQQDPRNTILHKPHQGFVCPDSNVLAQNCTTLNSA